MEGAGSFFSRFDRSGQVRLFRRWLWRPPRAHGEVDQMRTVSNLELLYDLVYVAVIGQATHHLAEHITTRTAAEFALIFAMIWVAWINGSFFLELHGRDDGRTRNVVFLQMGILALLAVFTARAAGVRAESFAVTYSAFLLVMTWLWYSVRREDQTSSPQFLRTVDIYLVAMALSTVLILGSTFLDADTRLLVWAAFVAAWVIGLVAMAHLDMGLDDAFVPTHSLVERLGLFVIVVLGEVVFGVVDGLSAAEHDVKTIATGMVALALGFGFWWVYFDLVGRRLPRGRGGGVVDWAMSHLGVTLGIAAAGAAMVSLIDHAHDGRTPAETAWLLSGAVALGLVAEILVERTLADAERLSLVYQPLIVAMAVAALLAVAVGYTRPAPWLLAFLLVLILFVVWLFAVSRFLRADEWGEATAHE
jgi:low temperature requirement protein LtrA